jgi:hypothetical protein
MPKGPRRPPHGSVVRRMRPHQGAVLQLVHHRQPVGSSPHPESKMPWGSAPLALGGHAASTGSRVTLWPSRSSWRTKLPLLAFEGVASLEVVVAQLLVGHVLVQDVVGDHQDRMGSMPKATSSTDGCGRPWGRWSGGCAPPRSRPRARSAPAARRPAHRDLPAGLVAAAGHQAGASHCCPRADDDHRAGRESRPVGDCLTQVGTTKR